MRNLSLFSQLSPEWEMTVISPWLFIAVSYAWLLMTATLRLLLQCEENLHELTAEEEEKREGERTADLLWGEKEGVTARWSFIEKCVECVKYYSIHLYLLGIYLLLFQGVPTVLNLLHLAVLSVLLVIQVCYKETLLQWYIACAFFLLLFCAKCFCSASLTSRYVMTMPVLNTRILALFRSFVFVQRGYLHEFELGFIPDCTTP